MRMINQERREYIYICLTLHVPGHGGVVESLLLVVRVLHVVWHRVGQPCRLIGFAGGAGRQRLLLHLGLQLLLVPLQFLVLKPHKKILRMILF